MFDAMVTQSNELEAKSVVLLKIKATQTSLVHSNVAYAWHHNSCSRGTTNDKLLKISMIAFEKRFYLFSGASVPVYNAFVSYASLSPSSVFFKHVPFPTSCI